MTYDWNLTTPWVGVYVHRMLSTTSQTMVLAVLAANQTFVDYNNNFAVVVGNIVREACVHGTVLCWNARVY